MNKQVIQEWVDALRSGEYPQTKGRLQRTQPDRYESETKPGFCCLGVLCEVAVKHNVIQRTGADSVGDVGYGAPHRHSDVFPTMPVQDWVGVNDFIVTVEIEVNGEPQTDRIAVTELNDVHGFTFDQIADLVESEFLKETTNV